MFQAPHAEHQRSSPKDKLILEKNMSIKKSSSTFSFLENKCGAASFDMTSTKVKIINALTYLLGNQLICIARNIKESANPPLLLRKCRGQLSYFSYFSMVSISPAEKVGG